MALGAAVMCDAHGRVRRVLADDLGITGAVGRGAHWTALVHEGSRAKADALDRAIRTRGAAFGWELNGDLGGHVVVLHVGGCKLGDGLVILCTASPDSSASVLEGLAMSHPLLRRHQSREASFDEMTRINNELASLQRELAKANVELAKKNAELARSIDEKNRLLGMAAHDLRNPLAVVYACGDVLCRALGPILSDSQRQLLRQILVSSATMAQIVDDLLRMTTLDTGALSLVLEEIDLVPIVKANVAMNGVLADKKGIRLELFAPDSLRPFEVDAGKLEQVLNNLIDNAVKFSNPGSTVTIVLSEQGGVVELSVTDRGLGIPPHELGKLFAPFSRTSTRPTAGEPSTGLGLAIVKRIVEGHGGTITAASEVGRGSTFTVRLPREQPSRRTSSSPKPLAGPADERTLAEAR